MGKIRHITMTVFLTGLFPAGMPVLADGVLNTTPANPGTVPSGRYTADHIIINTPRHGQGSFTIYRPYGYRHSDHGTDIVPDSDGQARDRSNLDQSPTYSGERDGNYSYSPRPRYRDYDGASRTYDRRSPGYYYYQQPVRPFQYYPVYPRQYYPGPGYEGGKHRNRSQCLGPHCGRQNDG